MNEEYQEKWRKKEKKKNKNKTSTAQSPLIMGGMGVGMWVGIFWIVLPISPEERITGYTLKPQDLETSITRYSAGVSSRSVLQLQTLHWTLHTVQVSGTFHASWTFDASWIFDVDRESCSGCDIHLPDGSRQNVPSRFFGAGKSGSRTH